MEILVDPPMRMIWSTLFLLILASLKTWVTGIMVFLKRLLLSFSNLDFHSCSSVTALLGPLWIIKTPTTLSRYRS